jgi:hypothetical protein
MESGLDGSGQPYILRLSGDQLVADRLVAGAWVSQPLSGPADTGEKHVLLAGSNANDALSVHWASGDALSISSNQSPATVSSPESGPDTTAPTTLFAKQTERIKGITHYQITLTPNETATTFFRFNGQGTITAGGMDTGDWQDYAGPVSIQLQKKGAGLFEFYARDTADNVEDVKTEVLE